MPDGEDCFTVSVSVVISPQFYAWLFGFGTEVEVVSPESVRKEVKELALNVAKMY